MKLTNEVRLDQLEAEMKTAGVAVNALGTAGDEVFTYTAKGVRKNLPAAAQAVVDAHVPVFPPDPRVARIDGMDLSAGDKTTLKELFGIG